MKVSVAITTYNRFESTANVIDSFIHDDRVSEIVVSDDASTDGSFESLVQNYQGVEKVSISRRFNNRNMSYNKYTAVSLCENEFVLLADSDNIFDSTYLDAFYSLPIHHSDLIYCPEYARPAFDYRKYSGMVIDKGNAPDLLEDAMFRCMLNTANYIVPKGAYMNVYKEDYRIKAADTIWMNYNWLKVGFCLYVVKGMQYDHVQHSGSGFLQDIDENLAKAKEIEELIKAL